MNVMIDADAASRLKNEMDLNEGDCVQFYVKLYGQSIHPNYSLGVTVNPSPKSVMFRTTIDGITFYISENDAWFFEGYFCKIILQDNDIEYVFEKLEA